MNDVFISYSRRNTEFARRLIEQLNLSGKNSWVDWEGISLISPNWWEEIKRGIESADSFLFITSPESMASIVCNMELNYAIKLGKRIIPLIYQDVKSQEAFATIADFTPDPAMIERLEGANPLKMAQHNWRSLSHINWIYFRESDDFNTSYQKLIGAVDTNLDYVRAHTRYLIRAQEWMREGKRQDLLLFGEEIERAETWRIQGDQYHSEKTSKSINPPVLKLHRAYIDTSREQDIRRRRILRNLRVGTLLFAFVGVLAVGLAVISWLSSQNSQRAVVQAENELRIIHTEVAFAQATATQSHILNDIMAVTGNVMLTSNNPPAQIVQMNELVKRYPDQSQAWNSRGAIYASQQNYQKALEDHTYALTLNPQDLISLTYRGLAYHELGEYDKALQDFQQIITIDPEYTNVFNNIGLVYHELGDYQKALEMYGQAIEINPADPAPLNNRALTYQGLDDYQKAFHDFNQAIDIYPDNTIYRMNRGVLHAINGNYEDALIDFNHTLVVNPQHANAFYNRGIIYHLSGEQDQALDDFNQAILIDPTNNLNYLYRGDVYHELGDYEASIQDYHYAILLDPTFARTFHRRGLSYLALGDHENALTDFEQAMSLDPYSAIYFYSPAVAHTQLGNYDRALELYTQAIEKYPQYTDAYNNRGNIYRELGDYQSALDNFNQLLTIDPTYAYGYYNRGLTYLEMPLDGDQVTVENIHADFARALELGKPVELFIRLKLQNDYDITLP